MLPARQRTPEANKIIVGHVRGTLAWFTPFDADEYYTLYLGCVTNVKQRTILTTCDNGRRGAKLRRSSFCSADQGIGVQHRERRLTIGDPRLPRWDILQRDIVARRRIKSHKNQFRAGAKLRCVRDVTAEVSVSADDVTRLQVRMSVRQREPVNIARALILETRLVFRRQTLFALEPVEQARLLALFERLQRDGLTSLFISHDMAMVRRV